MIWLSILGWAKDHWKQIGGVALVLLILLTGKLWANLNTAQGQLAQCQSEKAAAEKKVDVSAITLAQLEQKLKSKFHGNVDLEIDPGPPVAGGLCPPCPKIRLKTDCGGESEGSGVASAGATATASVTEKPGPGVGTEKGPDAWGLSVGGGMSLPSAMIYHASVALDYHAIRLYGTMDTNLAYTVGAQARVLTWNWP